MLTLNGAGIRSKFIFDIYIAALYLPSRTTESEAIIANDHPNRVLMHFLYSEVEKKKLVDGWIEGFNDNTPADQMANLQDRLTTFNSLFETVVEGDQILLDYLPNVGTQVTIKGELKGTIPGHNFNQALLRVWLGPDPVTSSLKDALLGIE
ncbi:MAG: chalcone isomerase family protein [Candidatus Polarisedimenticolaceae bacterium]|nr:chalcone isomerase family protein [Candidatus Polarisedimenticolaceae bacterium]